LLKVQIFLHVRGTPSQKTKLWHRLKALLNACYHAPSLNKLFARFTIVFGRLIRSAMMQISFKAEIKTLSELLLFHLFWYLTTKVYLSNILSIFEAVHSLTSPSQITKSFWSRIVFTLLLLSHRSNIYFLQSLHVFVWFSPVVVQITKLSICLFCESTL
jgi:hypothetical protein